MDASQKANREAALQSINAMEEGLLQQAPTPQPIPSDDPEPTEPTQPVATQPSEEDPQGEAPEAPTGEAEKAKNQLAEYQRFDPLLEQFKTDPNFQQMVDAYFNGTPMQPYANPYVQQDPRMQQMYPQQPQPAYPGPQPPQEPVESELPKPPEDFEPYEMLNPSTPSGKYFMQMLGRSTKQAVGEVQKNFQEELQMIRAEQIRREAEQQQYREFRSRFRDVDEGTASDFWQWVNNPSGVTIDNLFQIYKLQNSQPADQQTPQTRATQVSELINSIKKAQNYPQSVANNAPPEQPVDEASDFLAGLKKNAFSY